MNTFNAFSQSQNLIDFGLVIAIIATTQYTFTTTTNVQLEPLTF